ncbi:MarR family transcriptional regulator [Exilibacterium tricleocarpae]|uniref:MarR family transcriptional regulator n=1 Tax=Exilibacterium tricleocarpae TaxID=2591008 RepID=A0A545TLG5_9GAMM|nr:MarR family transcriptional regulator [Exilibacterium tricleocarpae]TQV78063.1 MarR family transcriptional regulator [Exilibacterium tricleocarpae]
MNKDRTANLLGALALGLTDALNRETEMRAEHGATAPAALVTVGFHPGESIDGLSRTLGLSHSATVRLVDRLTKDGLFERRGGADGRTSALYLTRRGQARRRAILQGRRRLLTEVVGPLSDDERAALTGLMERLLNALTRDRQHADHICRLCDERICPSETCPVECAVT